MTSYIMCVDALVSLMCNCYGTSCYNHVITCPHYDRNHMLAQCSLPQWYW